MALTGKNISLESILEKIFRDTGSSEGIDIYDVAEWAADALRFIGDHQSLMDKSECVEIKNHRGQLPCDMFTLETAGAVINGNLIPMRGSTSTINPSLVCDDLRTPVNETELTYKANNDFIFTSFKEGVVQVFYKGIACDDKGFPLIAQEFVDGVQWHIQYKMDHKLWRQGEIADKVFRKTEQERDWYIGQAGTKAAMPSRDQMESLKNSIIRLIPKINSHSTFFSETGNRERRLIHPSRGNRGRIKNLITDPKKFFDDLDNE